MQPAGEPVQWTGWTEYPSAGRSVIGPWTGWTVWTGVLDRLDRLLHDSVLFRLITTAALHRCDERCVRAANAF